MVLYTSVIFNYKSQTKTRNDGLAEEKLTGPKLALCNGVVQELITQRSILVLSAGVTPNCWREVEHSCFKGTECPPVSLLTVNCSTVCS